MADDLLSRLGIARSNERARAEFWRMILWIALAGVLMVIGALWYLSIYDALYPSAVIATIGGVFVSVLLGCGLFAAAFFSDKSGHDQSVTNATGAGRAAATSARALPDGLEHTRSTPDFTESTVPAALLKDHSTKEGSWGLIEVEQGALRYCVTDPRRQPFEAILTPDTAPGVVEPTILHHVEPIGAVRFHVAFWRAPEPAGQPTPA